MAATQVGATENASEPIAANTLNSTKVAGLAALAVAIIGGLGNSLPLFDNQGAAVKIAVFATIAVAFVVTGYITVADMRVRNQRTTADNYLRYLRDVPGAQPVTHNGHEGSVALSRVTVVGPDGNTIGHMLVLKDQEPPPPGGGDGERPGSFREFVQLYG